MTSSSLADIDELVTACRSRAARRYIAEAVACYHAGAYRACIVTTWIALLFDFVDKLGELELAGDAQAKRRLVEFEQVQEQLDVGKCLRFERGVLDMAKDEFELLTPLEYEDLRRLQSDRNRCAHPSMNGAAEEYRPSAELARYHLRNAIEYVLQRPPVQGKAALERLLDQVRSEYFPTAVDEAAQVLRAGPLARPRDALVRNFLVVLVKELLGGKATLNAQKRLVSAINATRQMHPRVSEVTFRDTLSELVRKVDDKSMPLVVWFLHEISDTWQYLVDDCRTRVAQYVSAMPDDDLWPFLPLALNISPLAQQALGRLQRVDAFALAELATKDPYEHRRIYLSCALDLWERSGSFRMTDRLTDVLVLGVSLLTETDVSSLLAKAKGNWQITKTYNLERLVDAVLQAGITSKEAMTGLIHQHEMDWLLDSLGD